VLGLIGSTSAGRDLLRSSGWTHPVSEIPKLVAVPNDATLDLLMQVPQPVYTGGSWTANFSDPEAFEELKKSAREQTVKSARNLREEAARKESGQSPATSARGESLSPRKGEVAPEIQAPVPPISSNVLARGTGISGLFVLSLS
jgi:hypothetical protein